MSDSREWTELDSLRTSVAAYHEYFSALGQYLVDTHKPGQVDAEAVAILDGYHVGAKQVAGGGQGEPGETSLEAALRLLRLAHARGAFGPTRSALHPLPPLTTVGPMQNRGAQ